MYINDIVKARTLPSQQMAQQRFRKAPLRVGTDVGKMAESRTQVSGPRGVAFAGSEAIAEKFGPPPVSLGIIGTIEKNGFSLTVGYEEEEETGRILLVARMDNGSGAKSDPFEISKDTRISLGRNGEYTITTGNDALKAGKLVGSDDDILIRISGVDVATERGDVTVMNFGKGGAFDGGEARMTYFGNYVKANFTGGNGGNVFGKEQEGVDGLPGSAFFDSVIEAGDNKNIFGGYFSNSVINGGEGEDIFNGIFTDGSVLKGNGGDDLFTGYFKDSELDGGKGYNEFLYEKKEAGSLELTFSDASMQYVGVTINGGEESKMNGVFSTGTSIVLTEGKHEITGAFQNATVNNIGSKNTEITAFYAGSTSFLGENGSTKLLVHSSANVGIALGDGDNSVILGAQPDNSTYNFLGELVDFTRVRFYKSAKDMDLVYGGTGHGSLVGASVDVTKGSTILDINTGLERSVSMHGQSTYRATENAPKAVDVIQVSTDEEKEKKAVEKRPAWLEAPSAHYSYHGEKKRRSVTIVPDFGLVEAVQVKTQFGITRYSQERNERLGYGKEYSLFTSRYDWQI